MNKKAEDLFLLFFVAKDKGKQPVTASLSKKGKTAAVSIKKVKPLDRAEVAQLKERESEAVRKREEEKKKKEEAEERRRKIEEAKKEEKKIEEKRKNEEELKRRRQERIKLAKMRQRCEMRISELEGKIRSCR